MISFPPAAWILFSAAAINCRPTPLPWMLLRDGNPVDVPGAFRHVIVAVANIAGDLGIDFGYQGVISGVFGVLQVVFNYLNGRGQVHGVKLGRAVEDTDNVSHYLFLSSDE